MIFSLLERIDQKSPFDNVSAHCDIPCKIYDPISAQLGVLTMVRMFDLLDELKTNESLSFEQQATFTRLLNEKERSGRQVKEEVSVIWGDYIKQPQLDAHPELHTLAHQIMLSTSFAKQHVDRKATIKLLENVNKFAEIYWQTKSVNTYRAKCPYPPFEVIVYPDLKG